MDYGVHLPLMGLGGRPRTLRGLLDYAEAAEDLGFRALSANDHLRPRPWLDGPTALAAVLAVTQRMDLVTTVALPVVRGPVPLAKSLAAIDLLSGGRLVVGVGPGSSARYYAAVGVPFEGYGKSAKVSGLPRSDPTGIRTRVFAVRGRCP